ncbi:MAG: undecaprenyl-diphosphate phosphatase [Synergistales bacterium]|nr:undecaprenyl-diphosphate phosphatase [Synergistales bacterium]MDY6401401.1 undecaprenyl-diphosphate phosphatase [Synergistales bacterium]MDY6404916.1 undecaprenyl-diphosphate phosphatase [Synergistales bacterium]MDY6410387.1 undecaprenyl-diphosphate phosphatase [Synergistales bacterium]MDY6414739.1 undecaprenyl-diphosphate phosphatase [Synergistales bacterium]
MFQTFILGAVQGLCEFLPVSSSGHLALLQHFFGLNTDGEEMVAFNLLLHFATVISLMIYFRREIFQVLCEWSAGLFGKRDFGWYYGWAILTTSFLTALIGLPMRKLVNIISASPLYVGCGLIFTAIILAAVPVMSNSGKRNSLIKVAIVVGIAQGIAVLPGVSRSGMTIAASILMGMELSEAFKFSFMISIPAILGANLLEFIKFYKSGEAAFMPEGYLIACAAAFVLGLLALGIMRRLVASEKWPYFGIYCFILGTVAIVISL